MASGAQGQREKEDKDGWAGGSGSGDPLAASSERPEAASSELLHCITRYATM